MAGASGKDCAVASLRGCKEKEYPRQESNDPTKTREKVRMARGALQNPVQLESSLCDPFLAVMIIAAPKLSENEKHAVLVLVETFLGSKAALSRADAPEAK
jgi:hypothetical protein